MTRGLALRCIAGCLPERPAAPCYVLLRAEGGYILDLGPDGVRAWSADPEGALGFPTWAEARDYLRRHDVPFGATRGAYIGRTR